ncbi:dipeptidase [Neocallimastix lanati (nom. inval.)]|nr:dipeptidase [Neocallimastix sp. JGI-2020a]
MTNYRDLAKKYEEDLISTLRKLVVIKSYYDESTVSEEHPFGKGVTQGLEFLEELARKDGFKTKIYDNKVLEIIAGDYEQNVTLLAHTDVVPAGGAGWEYDPFVLTEVDGVLRGRSVSDDKGSLLSSYYALKLLKDNNLLGKYQVRLLVGGNEESGSACMHHYFKTLKMKQPTLGFSPYADFPLIYAKKGIINYEAEGDFKLEKIHSFKGGVAFNSVIDNFVVNMDTDPKFIEFLKENKVNFTHVENGSNMDVTFIGKTAHGSTPEQGINACIVGVTNLNKFYNIKELKKIADLYTDHFGRGINAYNEKKNREETGDIESKPLAIGGGTYAKDADNVIAFGLIFPETHDNNKNSVLFIFIYCCIFDIDHDFRSE